MKTKLLILFCVVDDFCKKFTPFWHKHMIENGLRKRIRGGKLSMSEVLTIYIFFHQSGFRTFKDYYFYMKLNHFDCFPNIVSYSRFTELIPSIFMPLSIFLHSLKGKETGIYFVDSMALEVAHVKREKQNKVFKNIAQKSKSTMGWFYGFKLHLVINDKGEIMAFKITTANINDRKPVLSLVQNLCGKLVGDKGYISKNLFKTLYEQGLKLITRVKKNMKNKLLSLEDKFLLRKRGIIESVNDQLKNISQIQHTRYRNPLTFFSNAIAALCSYSLKEKKPSIRISKRHLATNC